MSNCKTISVCNQKGGVGKTTTTVNLGVGLAMQGKKVLLIDADPQGDLTTCLGWQDTDGLGITLATKLTDVINETMTDPMVGILHHEEGVDLVPANLELSAMEFNLMNAMSRETTLKNYLSQVKNRYDYVIIDCMPSLGMVTLNALSAADSVIIPVQAQYLPAKGMTQLVQTINLDCSKEFSEKIWKVLGKISECNPLVIVWDEEKEKMEFYEIAKQTIEYFAANNEDKKMETKYSVIMGMTCYIYRIYQEIIEKQMQNNISGRILFRTMLETYINLKYMMQQEDEVPDVYDRFKAYGNGKYKLVMAKLREEKYTVSDDSQIDERIMELMVNEDMDEAFVNISIGYFDKTSVRAKFKKCGEDELYEIYYEYATNFAHGIWGAIRESSMLICDNPAHIYHCVPDYHAEQNLRSVLSDCEMVMKKTFEAIADYIEFPEFYNI